MKQMTIKRTQILQIAKNNLYMLQYIKKYCKRHFAVTMFNAIIGSLSPIINLLFVRYIINDISAVNHDHLFRNVVFLVIVMVVYNVGLYLLNSHITNIIVPKNLQIIHQKMQEELFKKAMELDYESYENTEFYNSFSMAMYQSDQRALGVLSTLNTLLASLFGLSTLLTIISFFDLAVIAIVMAQVGISLIVNLKISKIQHEYTKERIPPQREQDYVKRVIYLRDYAKELRLFPKLGEVLKTKYNESFKRSFALIDEYGRQLKLFSNFQGVSSAIVNGGIMIYLAGKVINRSMLLGDFVAVSTGAQQLSSQLSNFLRTIPQMYEHNLYIENFKAFMDHQPLKTLSGSKSIYAINHLRLENVTFQYPRTDKAVLENISLEITAGEIIAIVGRNGAGKSTLVKLIVRLYEPDSGTIYINGANAKEWMLDDLRKSIGIVFQDYMVYSIPVVENVLMRPIVNKEEDEQFALDALRFAGLEQKISGHPKGLYAPLSREFDHDGLFLSGGEMQKLALARVYARDSSLIILDEPSSALDPISEKEMFCRMKSLSQDKCVILVSHRLENIMDADRIYVVEDGDIAESGTHAELMEMYGIYRDMYMGQARKQAQEVL
jgi:ATP-binding cassette, subfamily B, bacterial